MLCQASFLYDMTSHKQPAGLNKWLHLNFCFLILRLNELYRKTTVFCNAQENLLTNIYSNPAVYRQASNINMLKDGMKIEATHVKKKQLHQYLPPELVQRKKRVRGLSAVIGAKAKADIETLTFLLFVSCSILFFFPQSIAELNRSSNGGNSKRISLDSSHLDSSRDTDSGTPFTSPASKPSKPVSDTEDR